MKTAPLEFDISQRRRPTTQGEAAFTLTDLLFVMAVVVLLAVLAMPALGRSKSRSPAVGCLSNLRQLQVAWAMYADDYNGILMLNAPAGQRGWIGDNSEGWGNQLGNTNPDLYATNIIGIYLSGDITPLRCPGDVVPSDNGPRLRSYSMNGTMGVLRFIATARSFVSPWKVFVKEADLDCIQPKNAFIFCDEHPGTINDGYLQVSPAGPAYPDSPASYLEGGCGFSFADGHGEIHKWKTPELLLPVVAHRTWTYAAVGPSLEDWQWLRDHTSCPP